MTQIPASSHGASAVTSHQAFDAGSDVSIADNAAASLRWNGTPSYDTLLSTAVDTAPTAIATGVYAIALAISADSAMTVGGYYSAQLGLNNGDDNVTLNFDSQIVSAANQFPAILASATWYIKAGKSITMVVTNHDGVAARNFAILQAAVQRIA